MKLQFLTPGKSRPEFVEEGVAFYANRVRQFANLQVIETKEAKGGQKQNAEELKKQESDHLLKSLSSSADRIILLDERGKHFSSEEFAHHINGFFHMGQSNLVFMAGGAYGFSSELYHKAHEKMAISKMTFPHQLIRVMFLEQLYRAFTIIHNHPYHH